MLDAFTFSFIKLADPGHQRSRWCSASVFLNFTVLAGWSALYFGINFYLLVEEQIDQLQRLESQATSAQLAMLRYQLNPHFLFNTLNSISTLVLLKQTERANAMLTRLSSFLRYTLVNEPTAQVTLAQEVETLKLYLEIEKMRFEERLRPQFDIDPRVAKARLPSLLLQPLVENAIKYAVTPQEEGAEITVIGAARRRSGADHRIRHRPGLERSESASKPFNRRRPRQYPGPAGAGLWRGPSLRDAHRRPAAGFAVEIEIPFQLDEDANRERPHDHPHHPRRRRDARHPGPRAAPRTRTTTSRSSTPAPTAARRSARSRRTSPTSSSSTSRCPASTASRSSRG